MKKVLLLGLSLLMASTMSWAQDRTVSGKVTSVDDGSALPGVNVVVKGTTNGGVTDIDGNYKVSVPDAGGILVFSFIGLESQEIEIGNRSVIDVQMASDVQQLGEVVVTALGFEADKDKIGVSSSQVAGDAVMDSGEPNLLNGLQGKAAGVNIVSSSGDPGAGSRIVIRGATSITGNLEPLIVIDGMPMFNSSYYGDGSSSVAGVTQQSRLNDLNPEDIASMEVLKGASAAALWGSRAANGVIVITTKKGSAKKKQWAVDITTRVSIDKINKKVPLQNEFGQGFGHYYDGGFEWGTGNPFSWGDRISDRSGGADEFITNPGDAGYLGYYESRDGSLYYNIDYGAAGDVHGGKNDRTVYDSQDAIFRTATSTFNSVGLGNSSDNGSVYLSFSNTNQEGIVLSNSNYIRNTARLNVNQSMNNWLSFSGNIAYSRITSDRIQMGSNTSGLLLGALRTAPDFDITDYIGTYYDASGTPYPNRQRAYRNPIGRRSLSSYDNPLWTIDNNLSTSTVDRIIAKAQLDINPIDWLNITARVGVDTYTDTRDDVIDPYAATLPGGYYGKQVINERQVNADLIARANYTISDFISGNVLVGTNLNSEFFNSTGGTIVGFINENAPANLFNATADSRGVIDDQSKVRRLGYYISASAGFYDQVFLNLGGRLDYASTFASNDNHFFYPSADIAWQFTKLIGESDVLSFGKVRVAYGKVGREPGPYVTKTYYVNSSYTDGWGAVIDGALYGGASRQSFQAGNADIKPETKTETEFGLDLRFLKDRLSFGVTYYDNLTSNLIVAKELPNSTGFATTVANAAEISNKGFEIELDGAVYQSNDFTANVYANWSRNRNEVLSIEGTKEISLNGFTGSTSSAVVGEQLGVLYGDRWDRNESDGSLILDANGFPQLAATPGVIGDPNPDWRGAVGAKLNYKGISLNVLFEHSQGGDIWNGTKGALAYFGRAAYTAETTTLTAAQVNSLMTYYGETVADLFTNVYGWGDLADFQNTDGTYTLRGHIEDFGAGDVFVEESYFWGGPGSGFTGPTEQFIENATWTRLRELSIGYDFGRLNAIKNIGFTRMNLSFTGRNLALWTKYTGIDPDTNLSGPSNGFGLDYFNNPSTRSYVITLDLSF